MDIGDIMRIEKISAKDANGRNQTLEKMTIPADSVVFVLYDPHHKPVIQVFKDVNEMQTHINPTAMPGAV